MLIEERLEKNVVILDLTGNFFFLADGGMDLQNKVKDLIGRGVKNVLLDFRRVEKINSAGISVLMNCLKSVTDADGCLKICSVNESVRHIFRLISMQQLMDVQPSYDAALQSFPAEASA